MRAPKASTPSTRDALGQGEEFPENTASHPSPAIGGRSLLCPSVPNRSNNHIYTYLYIHIYIFFPIRVEKISAQKT